MDLKKMCRQVNVIAEQTANFIRNESLSFSSGMIESKGVHNYFSYVDKQAEEILVKELGRILPDAGFIAEEGTGDKNMEGLNWIIDPLDGTTNFIHGLPPFSISIALADRKKVILGVIYEITLDECFYSWEGAPAYMNDKVIAVSDTRHVRDSLIATGFPYTNFSHMDPFISTFRFFMENSHGLRRLGSAAVDLAYVACGRFDAFYEYGLNSWDVAAGAFIVRQAGGRLSDFKGGDDFLFGGELVASNGIIFGEFLSMVQQFMSTD